MVVHSHDDLPVIQHLLQCALTQQEHTCQQPGSGTLPLELATATRTLAGCCL